VRKDTAVLRTPVKMVAAALAAGAVLTACGSSAQVKLGAATLTSNGRISAATLSSHVANLNKYYEKYKGQIQLQYPVSQMPQEVLSWLIRFKVGDQMAARNGITVTPGQQQAELQAINESAKSSTTTGAPVPLTALAVENGLPPDMLGDLARYQAIQTMLVNRLDGGKDPGTQSGRQAITNEFNGYQCRAAKSLNIRVSPQYGQLDYTQISVVPLPSKLAADPGPTPSPSPSSSVQLTPHC
jgi:hypothetical protein